jgi:hypothetical protein
MAFQQCAQADCDLPREQPTGATAHAWTTPSLAQHPHGTLNCLQPPEFGSLGPKLLYASLNLLFPNLGLGIWPQASTLHSLGTGCLTLGP